MQQGGPCSAGEHSEVDQHGKESDQNATCDPQGREADFMIQGGCNHGSNGRHDARQAGLCRERGRSAGFRNNLQA